MGVVFINRKFCVKLPLLASAPSAILSICSSTKMAVTPGTREGKQLQRQMSQRSCYLGVHSAISITNTKNKQLEDSVTCATYEQSVGPWMDRGVILRIINQILFTLLLHHLCPAPMSKKLTSMDFTG